MIGSAASLDDRYCLEFRELRGPNQAKRVILYQAVFVLTFLACPRVLWSQFHIFVLSCHITAKDPFSVPKALLTSTLNF